MDPMAMAIKIIFVILNYDNTNEGFWNIHWQLTDLQFFLFCVSLSLFF